MTRDDLIQRAARVIADFAKSDEPVDAFHTAKTLYRMFEESLAPTGDDREALASMIQGLMLRVTPCPDYSATAKDLADMVLSLGFRRSEVPEPSALPDYFAPKPMPQNPTFMEPFSARSDYELGRMAGRDEFRAEQEERKRSGVWVEHAGHCAKPQGEPSDALLTEIEQRVYDENRNQIAGMAKALVRAGWDAGWRSERTPPAGVEIGGQS